MSATHPCTVGDKGCMSRNIPNELLPATICISACHEPGLASHAGPIPSAFSAGGDLPVVTAPRGVNLRVAISQALSQQQLEGSASAPRSGMHLHASMPGTPATLPCGLASPAGTPVARSALPLAGQEQQQQQAQQQAVPQLGAEGSSDAAVAAEEQPEGAAGSATWQWLLQSRFSSKAAEASSRSKQGLPEVPSFPALPPQAPYVRDSAQDSAAVQSSSAEAHAAVGVGGSSAAAALPAGQQVQGRQRATTLDQLELLEAGGPAVRLTGARPWSHDGVGGVRAAGHGMGLPDSLKPSQLEIAYRSRAAARMWPMLAPFVPRLLREYLVQHPAPSSSKSRWALANNCKVPQGLRASLPVRLGACLPACAPVHACSALPTP